MKKTLITAGIAIFLISGISIGVAKAENPTNRYTTIVEVANMINSAITPLRTTINSLSDRLSLAETAITGNTQEIQNLKNTMPTPQPTPPMTFDIFLNDTGITVGGQDVNLRFPVSTAEQRKISGANWHEPITNVQVWGILHTPDGDVYSGVRDEGSYYSLFFKMLNAYPGTTANADIYASYGGKTTSQTFQINL